MKTKQAYTGVHGRAQSLCYVVHGDWRYRAYHPTYWLWFVIALLSYIAEWMSKHRW